MHGRLGLDLGQAALVRCEGHCSERPSESPAGKAACGTSVSQRVVACFPTCGLGTSCGSALWWCRLGVEAWEVGVRRREGRTGHAGACLWKVGVLQSVRGLCCVSLDTKERVKESRRAGPCRTADWGGDVQCLCMAYNVRGKPEAACLVVGQRPR